MKKRTAVIVSSFMEKKSKRAFLYGLLPDGTKASSLEEAMKAWKIAKDGVVYMARRLIKNRSFALIDFN